MSTPTILRWLGMCKHGFWVDDHIWNSCRKCSTLWTKKEWNKEKSK